MKYIAIIIVILALFGCGQSEWIYSANGKDIVPVEEGHRWGYSFINANNPVENDTLSYIPTEFVGPDDRTGWYVIDWTGNEGDNVAIAKLLDYGLVHCFPSKRIGDFDIFGRKIAERDHLPKYNLGNEDDIVDGNLTFLIAKFPINVGDSWVMIDVNNNSMGGDLMAECTSLNKTINTPLGSFACVEYRAFFPGSGDPNEYESFYYYAPGYGLIYYYQQEDDMLWDQVLVDLQ